MDASQGVAEKDLDRPEAPTRHWLLLGYGFSALIVGLFIGLYALSTFQLDFWRQYFYYDSMDMGRYCSGASIRSSDSNLGPESLVAKEQLQALKLPHAPGLFIKDASGTGAYYHARYECRIPTSGIAHDIKGVPYLHFGWLIADRSQVKVNGELRANFEGNDKLSLPLAKGDLEQPEVLVEIAMLAKSPAYFGMCGNAPFVLTQGNQKNNKVFGLEIALQQVRQLYNILPVLTLGLFLVLAWVSGLRSRLVVITFCFFSMVLFRNVVLLLSEFWPWDLFLSYKFSTIFQGGTIFLFIVFSMEMINFASSRIAPLILASFGLVALEMLATTFLPRDLAAALPFERVHFAFNLCSCAVLIFLERRQRPQFSASRQKINRNFVYTISSFAALGVLDYFFVEFAIPVRLSYKIDIIMPLFIGGVVFYTLSLIEKEYREERANRALVERDMELARNIQDSLSPPQQITTIDACKITCFQKKHTQVAGDWLALREASMGRTIIVVADATGKGMQAALVIHAMQSLWAEQLDNEDFEPEAWLHKVNRTLHKLGQRQVHSMTAGVLVLTKDKVQYWSAGHLPVYLVEQQAGKGPKVKALNARGSVLGVSAEIKVDSSSMELNPALGYTILLGSDGIFPMGTRTKPSDVVKMIAGIADIGPQYIDVNGDDDDRTLVYIERQNPTTGAALVS